jgi:hypothetical protein
MLRNVTLFPSICWEHSQCVHMNSMRSNLYFVLVMSSMLYLIMPYVGLDSCNFVIIFLKADLVGVCILLVRSIRLLWAMCMPYVITCIHTQTCTGPWAACVVSSKHTHCQWPRAFLPWPPCTCMGGTWDIHVYDCTCVAYESSKHVAEGEEITHSLTQWQKTLQRLCCAVCRFKFRLARKHIC